MARHFKTLILFFLAFLFLMPDSFALSSNDSLQARKKWRKWNTYEKNYKGNVTKQKVIKFDRNSIRQPYEFSSPAFDGQNIYIGVHDKKFYAVGTKPRKKLWTSKTIGEIETQAVLSDNKAFIGDSDGHVYAFDKTSGKELWRTNILEPVSSSPAFDGENIYIISSTGRLFAINHETGNEIWHSLAHERTIGFSIHTSPAPVVLGNNIFIGTPSGFVISYDKNGKKLWEKLIGDDSADITDISDLKSDGYRIYSTTADGKFTTLEPVTGKTIWEVNIDGANSISIYDNDKVFVTGNNILYFVDSKTGFPVWSHEFENVPGLSPPDCGENFVTVSSTNKQLYVLAVDDGEIVLNRYLRGGSYTRPFVSNNTVYVLSNASRLYTFKVNVEPKRKK